MIIGITGLAQSGKSTLADILCNERGFVSIALADSLKSIAKEHFNWDGQKDDRGRRLLQLLGTEVGRAYDADLWVIKLQNKIAIKRAQGKLDVVVPDVRFLNEAQAIKNWGGWIVRLNGRGGLEGAAGSHVSESEMLSIVADVSFDNTGSLDDLTQFALSFPGLPELRGASS
jgi:hypothetical protein